MDRLFHSLSLPEKPCEGLSSLSRVEKNRLLDTRVGVPRMNFDDPYINGGEGRDKTDWIGLPSFFSCGIPCRLAIQSVRKRVELEDTRPHCLEASIRVFHQSLSSSRKRLPKQMLIGYRRVLSQRYYQPNVFSIWTYREWCWKVARIDAVFTFRRYLLSLLVNSLNSSYDTNSCCYVQ